MKHTEKSIQDLLHSLYANNSKYRIPNVYLFNWESDFFVMKDNGYCYEFEIKISKADFKKDEKKVDKHQILTKGFWVNNRKRFLKIDGVYQRDENNRIMYTETPENITSKRPNKFYYVVPSGMISKTDVPSHAGLITVDEHGKFIRAKEAPFLHKEKLDVERELCLKFYHYWMNHKAENQQLKREVERLQCILQENNITSHW